MEEEFIEGQHFFSCPSISVHMAAVMSAEKSRGIGKISNHVEQQYKQYPKYPSKILVGNQE